MTHDPRAAANAILDEAHRRGLSLTHLSLQKLVYFAHGRHLVRFQKPLVRGYFEAWEYGPAHPAVYQAFREARAEPIGFRAQRLHPLSGEPLPLEPLADSDALEIIADVLRSLGALPPRRLVDISHAKGGPWRVAVDAARNQGSFGMRISDVLIVEKFRYHAVILNDHEESDALEDSPFTRDRLGPDRSTER